ncbi:Hint domain-containing protein [Phaeovulum sp. W22_SRMD_FR3]|uniref:Hint domain-containing protein n=1 Tax=Phaeovulum sp. W22_SRMD_FR3 TaxID=3240274 RepID=UPI003F955FC5
MATYDMTFLSVSDMTTSAGYFDSNNGSQFGPGSTITLGSNAQFSTLSVTDDDAYFDDDDASQTLTTAQTLNGTSFAAGTMVEAEYVLVVRDSNGTEYRMQAVSMTDNAWTTYGFTFLGPVPPTGVPLTWVSSTDMVTDTDAYPTPGLSPTPSCFTPGVLIRTPRGERAIEDLQPGDLVLTLDHGPQPLLRLLRRRLRFDAAPHRHKPIAVAAGALGSGLPAQRLVVSPQHRLLLNGAEGTVLVAAKALLGRPGVRMLQGRRQVDYLHLLFDRHQVIWSNGMLSESFLPGRMALTGLDAETRREVLEIFPEALGQPQPARPIIGLRAARAQCLAA